jgi:hypothetical protein
MEEELQWKKSYNGRRATMEEELQWKKSYNGRRAL